MQNQLIELSYAIERGKENQASSYPPDMKDQPGAYELTAQLLAENVKPDEILKQGLMPGMQRIGEKFAAGSAYIPDILISARAMKTAMTLLKPFFDTGEAVLRGTIIIGTVAGDLHDIGKNIVRMALEGAGWQVIDLGVDATSEKFLSALQEYPQSIVGMSALLTTTMMEMEKSVALIKDKYPHTPIFVGGAPLTTAFAQKIGADGYFPDPHSFTTHLNNILP
ncbi:MAG: cobalamin-dependent protein [Candidatus Cloacimonetes bacterium]|nr:cobalamin-dependent protein [Candidatus Cloacimonadota bacterium]